MAEEVGQLFAYGGAVAGGGGAVGSATYSGEGSGMGKRHKDGLRIAK